MKKVSIVILNWNGKTLMERFLPSVLAHTPEALAEIVVADNGSADGSAEMLREKFPSVRLLLFDRNLGFAEGYNRAMAAVETPCAVLLNSDVEVTPHWLDEPLRVLDAHPDVVGVQPKIRSWKHRERFEYAGACGGFIDRYGYPFCRGRILNCVEEDRGQYDRPVEIFWASGACFFIRTDVYRREGGLDAVFFAHQEEIDLCWRLRARGYRLLCIPQSVVYHVGGATLEAENPRKTFLNFRNNLLMIYKNMPAGALPRVMRVRRWLDYLAAGRFLLTGRLSCAWAIVRARRAFRRLKKAYRPVRMENLSCVSIDPIPEMLPQNLLLACYLKRKKTFAEIEPE
ncbi:MAG: glycosyltransferase family 2 protein [Tannerella sp.]|jgi:GT2 family glycosyltransferase|nr:glycosyltransferase family 2 protein [Tannerella sp.]